MLKKYTTLFGLCWQKSLEVRSDFLFERVRSVAVLFSLYFLWDSLLANRTDLLGYNREQLLTYVLMMTLLRAWVLACVTDRLPSEIAKGKLSDIILKPISQLGYWATQDMANKSINLISAVFEVGLFVSIVSAPFLVPHGWVTWVGFALSVVGAMIIYFQLSYMLGVMGFWTAQSWGPRFCFEIILEFCAGAYFPIDLLPQAARTFLSVLPFPYLVFYPVSIYLGRVDGMGILQCLAVQWIWIFILSFAVKIMWAKGLKKYAAEGR